MYGSADDLIIRSLERLDSKIMMYHYLAKAFQRFTGFL